MPPQVGLPIVERGALDFGVDGLDEVGPRDVDVGERGRAGVAEIDVPLERGAQRLKLAGGHLVVNLLGIAPRYAVQRSFGKRSLESHYDVGVRLRLFGLVPGKLEHLL